jgi:uncharacterized protein YcaQ
MKELWTLKQLQRATLESQKLTQNAPFGKGKNAVLNALEHLGYIQIDTLSVVERAHHHTLWTRIPDYKTTYLDDLVTEHKVFEYWFHAASYLPMKDYRFVLPQMLGVKQNGSKYYNADTKVMQYVMDTIRAEGPKRAIDFDSERMEAGSWWNWKPAKLALERLFMQGDLMICERKGMQKAYDLRERVLPQNIDISEPSPAEFAEYLVKTYLRAYGFTTVKQITHLKIGELFRKNVNEILASMISEGTVVRINIEGMPSVFVRSDLVGNRIRKPIKIVKLLSPFDNSIIHRDRIKQLFDFDFRLECYTPQGKRQFGYFCLPILFGDTFIGRVDCKAHRKEKEFEIIHLHIENKKIDPEFWLEPFIASVKSFANFNNCTSIKLTKVSPSESTNAIRQLL